jgi:beta-phosphoglucomutase
MSLNKVLFFDLDGTLVNTHEANFEAYSEAIKSVNINKTVDYNLLKTEIQNGVNSKIFLSKLVTDITTEDISLINKYKADIYPKYLHKTTINNELLNYALQAKATNKLVLVTTAKQKNATAVLKHHNIENIFDAKIFGDNINNLKPDPEIYNFAADYVKNNWGYNKDEIITFEDSISGIIAAEEAQIRVIKVIKW